jgi:hypothetical protein
MRQQSGTRASKYKNIVKLFMGKEGYSGAFLVPYGLQRQ